MEISADDLQLRELKDTISELNSLIKSLQETIASANAQNAELKTERDNLKAQVDFLTKKLFGKSSERGFDIPGQMNLFNELEAEGATDVPDEDQDHDYIPASPIKRKSRRTKEELFKGIPVEKKYLDVDENKMTCPECGSRLEYIGEEFVRRELEFIPAAVRVVEIYSKNYGCPHCKLNAETPHIVKGKDGRAHMLHGMASASTIAWIIYQKYCNSMPLYRQEKDWLNHGVTLTRATMSAWVIKNTSCFLKVLYDCWHRLIKKRPFIMADESPVQVLREPGRRAQTKSYMWLFRTGERDKIPIILYHYSETRAGDNARDYLDDYDGYIMCDGYSGYNKLKKAKRTACWAHIRRYLIDAIPNGKQMDFSQPAVQGLLYVEKLFAVERTIKEKGLTDEKDIRAYRLGRVPKILEGFLAWYEMQRPVKNSRFDKAITYIRNRRPYLSTYLENGFCSLHNNASEQCMKAFVIGRKNWLFSDTPKGADASAVCYSIIETAKANGMNPYYYLKYLFENLPNMDLKSDEALYSVSPWNPALRARIENLSNSSSNH